MDIERVFYDFKIIVEKDNNYFNCYLFINVCFYNEVF